MVEWWKSNKALRKEINDQENKIKLMQEYIGKQTQEINKLRRELKLSQRMWDISNNTKKY